MPQLDENTQQLLNDVEHGARRHTFSAWDSFSNFALRENVLEVAVGLMYAPLLFYILYDSADNPAV
jgi:large conductance mechanosensitive channel